MSHAEHTTPSPPSVIPLGFATAVSMWAMAYLCHLPVVMAPGWSVFALMLAAAVGWGVVVGRSQPAGWGPGFKVGATAAVLNLLILGSLLGGEGGGLRPAAVLWVPGSVVALALVVGVAARLGRSDGADWPLDGQALFAWTAVGATFLLVVAGGLVTSAEAGLAVVDWPNTFGTNMFLYPLSRMTGGIYYEHAHRLFGALVGLTTVSLALYLWRTGASRRLTRVAGVAVVIVIVQGVLGGLRVTGGFTLSTSPEAMAPQITLAVLHGVLGQIFLALLVGIAVASLPLWRRRTDARPAPGVATDRSLQAWLVVVLVIQLVLGAVQRHLAFGVTIHVSLAAVVALMAVMAGARAWWLRVDEPVLSHLGRGLTIVVGLQLVLGVAALVVTGGEAVVGTPSVLAISVATAHQACGALLLATAVSLALLTRRLLEPSAEA